MIRYWCLAYCRVIRSPLMIPMRMWSIGNQSTWWPLQYKTISSDVCQYAKERRSYHYDDVIMSAMASQSTASPLFAQPFIQAHIKENIKAPRHWPLCGNSPGTGEFPTQKASNEENVSIWWRHYDRSFFQFSLAIIAPIVYYLGSLFYLTRLPKSSIKISVCIMISNYVIMKGWDLITHPCPNFNGCLVKPPLKLRPGWLITFHIKQWVWLLMHALI